MTSREYVLAALHQKDTHARLELAKESGITMQTHFETCTDLVTSYSEASLNGLYGEPVLNFSSPVRPYVWRIHLGSDSSVCIADGAPDFTHRTIGIGRS